MKTIAIGTELSLGRLHILNEPLYLLGSPLQHPGLGDFIRLLGRHALPHRFQRQDLAKFMKAGHRAMAAVTQLSFPSHFPISMYNGVAGGTQRWCAQVQPPLYHAMRLGDLPVASRLCSIWHLDALTPPEAFLQPRRTGWVGLESSPYIMYCSFMETYTRQLNHSNPLVHVSTRHGLLQAKQKFHPSMQCLAAATPQECLQHADGHSRFLVPCYRVCLEVHVPEEPLYVPTVFNPMHLCVHEWQTDDVHFRMDAGYASLSDAVHSCWPCRFQSPPLARPPLSQVTSVICPVLLDIAPPTEPVAHIHAASWYPGHYQSGGALAVLNLPLGVYKLYPVHIPIFCSNSYQVAWVVLQSRIPNASAWRGATWTFSDSQSYISAPESRNDGNCPFISALLQRCRSLSSQWEVPRHLYSHLQGTFLDEVLERVDSCAKDVALRQQPASGWIAGLQDPMPCFVDQSAPHPYHVHDPQPLFRHRLRRYLKEAVSLPPI